MKRQIIKHAWQRSRLAALALISFAATVSFAQDFAFPSPMAPNASTEGFNKDTLKQIVSFIWDDNAYSGKTGTNYEGSDYPKSGAQFTDVSWVGGKRVEGDWSTTGKNTDNIKEGDFGMSWAAKTLAGYPSEEAMRWLAAADYKQGDEVIYNGKLWKARAWTGKGTVPGSNYPPANAWDPGWDPVKDLSNLTPSKTNPDGSPITMTFNVITGLVVSAFPITWESRESKYGYYIPNAEFYPDGKILHTKISVTWGREYAIYNDQTGDAAKDPNKMFGLPYLEDVFQEAIDLGHEIGNHTIDHMETNSPLPMSIGNPYPAFSGNGGVAYMDGFGLWNGEGMDEAQIDEVEMPNGEKLVVDEAKTFAQKSGNIWQFMGWKANAGKVLSKDAWKGLIELGEKELTEAFGVSAAKGTSVSFRAPRLEVNSNMFWALKDLGYLYDCGNEEGYEYNMDGTNYLWPYTMDNGSPNVAWQRMTGENKSNFDSLPQGLWQYPVSVLIVPEENNHRLTVWNSYAEISEAEGRPQTDADKEHFMKNGKITGFDFNLFILYGATKDAAIATMRHSLDQRRAGGKAPMQIGCHTDYFTPVYDNATLSQEANAAYGLALKSNTWEDRIAVWEDIVTYGLSKNDVYFWDGKKTIEYVKSLYKAAKVGETETSITDIGDWEFVQHNEKANSTVSGDINDATITTDLTGLSEDDAWEQAGFAVYGSAGEFEFDHISLSYSTSAPISIRLITGESIDQAYPYEVTLNNLNGWDASVANKNHWAKSGFIPLSAFQRNQYVGNDYPDSIGLRVPGTDFAKKITGIEVSVQVPEGQSQTTKLAIKDFKLRSGNQIVGGVTKGPKATAQRIAVLGMTKNSLKFNLAQKGLYNIDVVSVNGRLVKSFRDVNLNAGVNTLPLNNLSTGMYMIRISNKAANVKTTLKSMVL